jgi:flagellin
VSQIGQELGNIASQTSFNGNKLLTGSQFTFQVGANDGETIQTQAVSLSGNIAGGGLSELSALSTTALAKTALASGGSLSLVATVDTAINNISTARANYGAVQNRLEHRLNNLATYQENLTASESRIRDVDMAAEMTNYTKENILQQAGTSMLAQANQAPQSVLSLLR